MVVTVGFFDGVHVGHRRVLRTLLEAGEPSVVVTFWPHPRIVLQQDARDLFLLNSREEKFRLLKEQGVQEVRCMDFTRTFAAMGAGEFLRQELVSKLGCTRLVLGYDNRMGADGLGSQELAAVCAELGVEIVSVPPCIVDDVYVSSTRIRHELACGDVCLASRMLGYRYGMEGIVVPGNKMGRKLGFPTANIRPTVPNKIVPGQGVYATRITVDGKVYKSMTDIGVKPTMVADGAVGIETNIFDFDEDIYGKDVYLEFVARIRDEKKFNSQQELSEQLRTDMFRSYGCN